MIHLYICEKYYYKNKKNIKLYDIKILSIYFNDYVNEEKNKINVCKFSNKLNELFIINNKSNLNYLSNNIKLLKCNGFMKNLPNTIKYLYLNDIYT